MSPVRAEAAKNSRIATEESEAEILVMNYEL
jgi:hypothetical protein